MNMPNDVEFPKGRHVSTKLVSKWTALSWINRMSARMGAHTRADHTWRFSPAAMAQICMLSNGQGGLTGDEIYHDKAHPSLRGCRVEIVPTEDRAACRFALADDLSGDEEWYDFEALEANAAATSPLDVKAIPIYSPI